MKEIIISIVAIVLIAVAASFGLDAMDWTATGIYTSTNVRL